jgi:hypothetical protein
MVANPRSVLRKIKVAGGNSLALFRRRTHSPVLRKLEHLFIFPANFYPFTVKYVGDEWIKINASEYGYSLVQ